MVTKGKKPEEDHPKREVPPDAPIIDVSREVKLFKLIKKKLNFLFLFLMSVFSFLPHLG